MSFDIVSLKISLYFISVTFLIILMLYVLVKYTINTIFQPVWRPLLFKKDIIELPYGDVNLGRIVVCAANRNNNNDVILGARHWDSLMHSTLNLKTSTDSNWQNCEQGFIDQRGVFMTRIEAWVVAVKANQIRRLVGGQTQADLQSIKTKLYSENLY